MKSMGFLLQAAREACDGAHALCGVDLVDLTRFARDVRLGGERFLNRIFTPQELDFSKGRLERLAARFAAKEAASKVLGTGIRGIGWQEIEVVSQKNGQPLLALAGRAARHARRLGITRWSVSLTHTDSVAAAVVVATLATPELEN
jgi:holo-[acyl-carrier protein] synthase